ncbi:MAG: aspartate aminotransferase family protein [Rhizobiaceae bacterium]
MATNELLARRQRLLGKNISLFYENPVHIVRGQGVWLWDAEGCKYLDCYNNVPHVGHCHPAVVEAICKQAATLNTHTRYLHNGILDYVERLVATFEPPLSTAILTCTGSEANDIALRMAQAVTGKTGIIATDSTYHGNTSAVSQLSTRMPPIGGHLDHIRHVPAPDSLRPESGNGAGTAAGFADNTRRAIEALQQSPHGFSALILCPYFANEGFPDLPAGFLDETVLAVREAGGIVIADEVQPGFGRTGGHMWGHQRIGLTPDVVTMGKPMGNGHPVAGVVASQEIMSEFRGAFRYFNTFGGNPVSCAAAAAVLNVLEAEDLLTNAASVGAYTRAGLERLAERHPCLGDVRGHGFFFGTEVVTDRETMTPDPGRAGQIVDAMREEGVLMGKTGMHGNTLKIRPPMPFSNANADLMLETLGRILDSLE